MPLCGLISHYNDDAATPCPDRLPKTTTTLHQKGIHVQGLIILDPATTVSTSSAATWASGSPPAR